MATKLLDLFGGASGSYSKEAADDTSAVVPLIFGRCWVAPVLLFAQTTTNEWGSVAPVGGGAGSSGKCADAIFALGQAGLTIRGVRVNGVKAGQYRVVGYQGSAQWVKVDGEPDPYWGLLNVLSGCNVTSRIASGNPGAFEYEYSTAFAPLEVVNAAASPWGRRTGGGASARSTGQVTVPQPTWTSITGSAPPAWSHLDSTEWRGLAYSQLTTIRCWGVPLVSGQIRPFEVLVDGIGGENCSPVTAIRYILTTLMRIPAAKVITDKGPDGATASSYEAWCAAMASTLRINAAVAGDPVDLLEDLLRVTCSEIVPLANGGVRVQPYADTAVGSYSPPSTAIVVNSNDIVGDVVEMEERPQEECFNSVIVSYTDPSTPDTTVKVPGRDEDDITATQARKGPTISSDFISSPAHARFIADLEVRRSLRNRRSWPGLALTLRFLRSEQGDLLEIRDPRLPVSVVRITKRDIDIFAGTVTVDCEEWAGDTHPLDITPDLPAGLAEVAPSAAEVEVVGNAQQAQLDAVAAQAAAAAAEATADAAQAAASAAATAAGAAQTSANSALAQLTDIASDSILSPVEKPQVIREHAVITSEQAGIDAQATAYSVSRTAYDSAITTLTSYLGGLAAPVAWNNLTGNTTIVGSTFRQRFQDVYTARQALLNAIYAAARTRADAAQSTANGAASAAAAAQSTADTAASSASAALQQLTDIASDSLLSPVEKPQVIREYAVITGEQAGIDAQADAFAVSRSAYDSAVATLTSYLGGLTSPTAWNNPGGNTTIAGGTFRTRFQDVYTARQALLNAIYAAARARADAAQSTANGASSNASAALQQLADIAADGVLTPGEKPQVIREWNSLDGESAGILAQASAAGVDSSAYASALAALSTALNTTWVTPVPYSNLTGNTSINGATFRTLFTAAYTAKQALLNAISAKKAPIELSPSAWGRVQYNLGSYDVSGSANVLSASGASLAGLSVVAVTVAGTQAAGGACLLTPYHTDAPGGIDVVPYLVGSQVSGSNTIVYIGLRNYSGTYVNPGSYRGDVAFICFKA